MTTTHIDGPWTVVMPGESDNYTEFIEIDDPYGRTASVYGDSEDEEVIATANLIGSAPDLFHAAKLAAFWFHLYSSLPESSRTMETNSIMIDALNSAIAKAERGTP